MKNEKTIFLALDVDRREEALRIAREASDFVMGFKVGPRLSLQYGRSLIEELAKLKPVFIDNKYYDIPNTMLASIQSSFDSGASYCTIHAQCGPEALREIANLENKLNEIRFFKVLCVTILTSFNEENLSVTQIKRPILEQVQLLVRECVNCGLSGFVCSAQEVKTLKEEFPDAYFVTPGIRFKEDHAGDQKRVVEPSDAFLLGANAIVVGRPIYKAQDIKLSAQRYFNAVEKGDESYG